MELGQVPPAPRKPRILLAATGCVAAMKFDKVYSSLTQWAEVRAVATRASLNFIDRPSLPKDVFLYMDEDEASILFRTGGGDIRHIELCQWADIMVIAPLSANTFGKIAMGLCDNLVTSIARTWDYKKPMFIAPSMNILMWSNPITDRHLTILNELGVSLIPPARGSGAMAEPSEISNKVILSLQKRAKTAQ